ncbi:MAG: MerR family transcriptional regulator [Sedimentitalea sp.]
MSKSPDAFRTISEVADWLGIQAHVLRFWESKFTQVKPVKRAGGRRYYRPIDMQLLGGIKSLLHDDGLTIKGVQKILREQGVGHVSDLSPPLDEINLALPEEPETMAPVLRFKSKAPEVATTNEAPADEPEAAVESEPTVELEEPALEEEPEAATADPAANEPEPEPTFERSLPSFLSRPARSDQHPEAAPATETEPEPEPQPVAEPEPEPELEAAPEPEPPAVTEPEPPQPRKVDAPDPPDESEIPYAPGVLAAATRLPALSAEQARQIAPLADALRDWLARGDDHAGG